MTADMAVPPQLLQHFSDDATLKGDLQPMCSADFAAVAAEFLHRVAPPHSSSTAKFLPHALAFLVDLVGGRPQGCEDSHSHRQGHLGLTGVHGIGAASS